MEIQKVKNTEGSYDIWLKKDNKELKIMFAGNQDLYISLSNGDFIPQRQNTSMYFDITKENYEIFSAFDKLYNNIINGNIFDKDMHSKYRLDYLKSYDYHNIVDKEKNINWISDDGPEELEDRITISKSDEDTYRLTFFRNDKELDCGFKSNTSIFVRFRTSGSRYGFFYCPFMIMFQELQNLDPKYHQIHFAEIEYAKKLEKKLNSTHC